jgi:ketopantoate reductase
MQETERAVIMGMGGIGVVLAAALADHEFSHARSRRRTALDQRLSAVTIDIEDEQASSVRPMRTQRRPT